MSFMSNILQRYFIRTFILFLPEVKITDLFFKIDERNMHVLFDWPEEEQREICFFREIIIKLTFQGHTEQT